MPTSFFTLWSGVKANFDRQFGETFTIQPRLKADANSRGTADAARPPVDFIGVWRDPHAQAYPHSPAHADSSVQRFGEGKPTVDYDVAALPFKATQADIILRPATGERFGIADIADDGFTRVKLALTASTAAPKAP